MSELTPCNYCTLRDIKDRWEGSPAAVRVMLTPDGVRVYVIPKSKSLIQVSEMSGKEREPFFVAWFMELTDHCVC